MPNNAEYQMSTITNNPGLGKSIGRPPGSKDGGVNDMISLANDWNDRKEKQDRLREKGTNVNDNRSDATDAGRKSPIRQTLSSLPSQESLFQRQFQYRQQERRRDKQQK